MGSLPTGSSLPTGTSRPAGTSLPASSSLPAGTAAGFGLRAIFLSSAPLFYVDSSRAGTITQAAGVASAWVDPDVVLSATAAGAAQPTYTASDAAFNGQPSLASDGAAQFMGISLDRPPPGTQATFILCVARFISHTASDALWGTTTSTLTLVQGAASPTLAIRNTTAGPTNGNLAVGTAGVIGALYNNSTTDYLRINSTAAVTGTNVGNIDPGATIGLFARSSAGGAVANAAMALFCVCAAEPTPAEYTAALAYCNATFGTPT